jgi:single-strand DNA-binding protein
MSITLNEVLLVGGLGRDPELKTSGKGGAYCNLALATTDGKKGHEKTNWHKVTLFGANAQNAAKYLKKGSQVFIKGILTYNDWTDRQGQKHREAEVVAFQIIYLTSPQAESGRQPGDDDFPY